MKFYKLLTQDMTSHKDTKWELNKTITVTKEGNQMCTDQVLHCYNHPLLAILFNPLHADISNPRLFEINVDEIVNTDGLKYASKSQTLIKELTIPEISLEQRIEFGIRVAKLVYKDTKWNTWADNWLDKSDRTKESAYAAGSAAAYAYHAAANAACHASYAAARAARDANADAADAVAAAVNAAANRGAYAATCYADKHKFNKQMIEIIESIIKKD
jgi:hypothetical protein